MTNGTIIDELFVRRTDNYTIEIEVDPGIRLFSAVIVPAAREE